MLPLILLSIACQSEHLGGTVKVHLSDAKNNKVELVELYHPGGLGVGYTGESFLDSSYIPHSSHKQANSHGITYDAALPMNGVISLSVNTDLNQGTGSIRFPGSNPNTYELTDCKKINKKKE